MTSVRVYLSYNLLLIRKIKYFHNFFDNLDFHIFLKLLEYTKILPSLLTNIYFAVKIAILTTDNFMKTIIYLLHFHDFLESLLSRKNIFFSNFTKISRKSQNLCRSQRIICCVFLLA